MNKKSRPGRLRIVAGKWRSRLLEIADVPGLRPTSERIRETLFNWLAPGIHGARCLDLFAGTGALGLEALSRGASEVVFVEKSRRAATALRKNIASLEADGAELVRDHALRFLGERGRKPFDIVFLDPPFAADMANELCRLLDQAGLVTDGGQVYIEDDKSRPEVALPEGWHCEKSGQAGNVRYSLVRKGD